MKGEKSRSMLPLCPRCQQDTCRTKSGYNKSRSQRYLCLGCHRYYTPEPATDRRHLALKEQAFLLYADRYIDTYPRPALKKITLRTIAQELHVHHQTVARWIHSQMLELQNRVVKQVTKLYQEGKIIQWELGTIQLTSGERFLTETYETPDQCLKTWCNDYGGLLRLSVVVGTFKGARIKDSGLKIVDNPRFSERCILEASGHPLVLPKLCSDFRITGE
jgi:transposase-like protein